MLTRYGAALLVSCALLAASLQAAPNVADKVQKLQSGKRIQVVLQSGEKMMGKRGATFPDHFVLEPDNRKASARELKYADIQKITTKLTTGQKWMVAGAIYGGITILSAVTLGN